MLDVKEVRERGLCWKKSEMIMEKKKRMKSMCRIYSFVYKEYILQELLMLVKAKITSLLINTYLVC